MSMLIQNELQENKQIEKQWISIYKIGSISAIIILISIFMDIIIGSPSSGNLSALPQTAVERFIQFQKNWLLGLYNLDMLNVITQIIWIPVYFAFYAVHRKINPAFSILALIVFLVGTIIYISNNSALPMLELSNKYAASRIESQKILYAAAGEALLVKGAHGSLGYFIGLFLVNSAGMIISFVMLRGKIFSKITSYLGIAGSILMFIYIILVTFSPTVKGMAAVFAAPGGLCLIGWMILFTIKLFNFGKS